MIFLFDIARGPQSGRMCDVRHKLIIIKSIHEASSFTKELLLMKTLTNKINLNFT